MYIPIMGRQNGDTNDRRRFLKVLGALGVTGLAGCGGDGDGDSTTDLGDTTEPMETTEPMTTTQLPGTTTTDGGTPTYTATDTATGTSTPTMTDREPQFVSMYDGGSIEESHWHQVNGEATYETRDGTTIVGISSSSGPNSFLSSYKVYDDFVLEFETWVDPDGLNSGIQIRSHTSQSSQHVHGPQVELELSGDGGQIPPGESGYVYGEALGTGWLSDPQAHDTVNNGEWNDFRIHVEGERIQTFINETQIEDLDISEFDLLPMGVIALQVHSIGADGREVRWRNIRIKELDVAEWTRLFTRNTKGWTNPLDRGSASVSDGVLELSGDRSFFLLSEDSSDDFVFETWVNADAQGEIMFRNPGVNRVAGYSVDVDPTDSMMTGSLYSESGSAYLKDISGESFSQMAFKPDGWNYVRILADGETLRVWVNGITTAEVTDDAEASGHIGLQHGGGDGTIQFREMEIKPIGGGGM
jgi:hypothetical protein